MGDERAEVLLRIVPEPEADAGEVEILTAKLRRELLELDEHEVRRPRAGAPAGARGVDAAAVGNLVIGVLTTASALAAIIHTIRSWVSRSQGRSVKLEIDGDVIEIAAASTTEQKRLITAWIERHAKR